MKILMLEKFEKWYKKLDITQKTEIDVRLTRIALESHYGVMKKIGTIYELKFKSGLRVYFGFDGKEIILLLNGGNKNNKKGQSRDIEQAKKIYEGYRNGK